VHCTKISPEYEFGVKGQRSRSPRTKTTKCGIFRSGTGGRGPSEMENIFSIAGVAGVAAGHATTSVSNK